MIKPGMFISDRYEIIDKVGSGGMADVYKAKCHRLNRYVAIKILKSEFSSDKNFVSKFRAEAQSVAGLSHPNIVSVYDVGDDDGLYYIVMELVEGITLKRFIERKGKLDVKEAVGIAIQISQGLEAAHENHIIHRDIKPQNIIISRDGKVKVADFGIAKAATSNTVSQNAIGSVHYLSPEQARGGYSDMRSDIYSLGVTLYEMLCGQVPFAGDNSVSVALLHIQSEATPIQMLNQDVPNSVDRIVQKCMQKKPERRYQSASELIRDLKRSILNPDGDYVNIPAAGAVPDSPTREMTTDEMSHIKSAAKTPPVYYESPSAGGENHSKKIIREEEEELDSVNSKLEKVITVMSIVAAVALMIVILYVLGKFFGLFGGGSSEQPTDAPTPSISLPVDSPTPVEELSPTPDAAEPSSEPLEMIDVKGLTIERALIELDRLSKDFTVDYKEGAYSDEYEAGQIISQYPEEGTTVNPDEIIKLVYSFGKELVQLEDVAGQTAEAATSLLTGLGYTVVPVTESNDEVEAGKVIRMDPEAGTMVEKSAEIIIYVSEGSDSKPVEVPGIIGRSIDDAKKVITDAGLEVGTVTYEYSDEYPEDIVCGQEIWAGESTLPGTAINFSVSMGSYSDDAGDDGTQPDGDAQGDGSADDGSGDGSGDGTADGSGDGGNE